MENLPSEQEKLMQKYTRLLEDVGDQIRSIRKSQGLYQVDLAGYIEADKAFISNIENGHTNFTVNTLLRISFALDKELIITLK